MPPRNGGMLTAQQIGDKLRPLGCTAAPPAPSTGDINIGGIKPKAELDCTVNNESVTIDEYLNAQQVSYNMNLAKGIGCSFAKSFGLTDLAYDSADNWTVSPSTLATTQFIQHTLGGSAKTSVIHCN